VVEVPLSPKIGDDPKGQLDLDLHDEADDIKQNSAAVAACVAEGDNGSSELFLKMIQDEERHADHLEMQLGLISEVGIKNCPSGHMQGE
jgi:bacterioferritin (cytochrome b1)